MIYNEHPIGKLVEQMTIISLTIRKKVEAVLKTKGITWAQFGCLQAIAEREGLSQVELARLVRADANTVRVVCDGLEKRGLANRISDPSDRRIHRIAISEKGRTVLSELFPGGLGEIFMRLALSLPEERARQIVADLEPLLTIVASMDITPAVQKKGEK